MKLTAEQTAELKAMCMDEVSNADIASHFGVPLTEIHAARSRLGFTRDKVKVMKGAEPHSTLSGRKPATENTDFSAAVESMFSFVVSVNFRLKNETSTCYRFVSGERPDFNTLYIKKSQIDGAGIDPLQGVTITIRQTTKREK